MDTKLKIAFTGLILCAWSINALSYTVSCRAIGANIEVTNVITAQPYSSILFWKIGDVLYKFDNNIYGPILPGTEEGNFTFLYYIPPSELASNIQPFKARIVMIYQENGKIIRSKSVGMNANCTVT